MWKNYFLLSFCLQWAILSWSQSNNIGIPPILNYTKEHYRAGTQNWSIAQDQRGLMYFANNDGLLVFNGAEWQNFPITNRTILHSLAIDQDGKIYVGGQGEIGYFRPNEVGVLVYESLAKLIPPEHRNFTDVWKTIIHSKGIFFQSAEKVFLLDGGQIRTFTLDGNINFMGQANQELILQKDGKDLLIYKDDRFVPLSIASPQIGIVTSTLGLADQSILITTLKKGIYVYDKSSLKKWKSEADDFLVQNRIYSAALLNEQSIVLGTSLNGFILLSQDGKVLRHINKAAGLQNNNVLSLFADAAENLWLGLDNGIDYVEISSPFSKCYPDGNLEGSIYASRIYKGQLYCASSNGLYQRPWQPFYDPFSSQEFELVNNSTGQSWSLSIIDDQLLMGHHEGAFLIEDNQAKQISEVSGAWIFLPIANDLMIGGHYNGLNLFDKQNGKWKFKQNLDGLKESARIIVHDEAGNLWMAHPYRGIFRIRIKDNQKELDVRFYGSDDGLPSNLGNHVFKIKNQVIIAAEKGIYQYDDQSDSFHPNDKYNNLLGTSARVKKLQEDSKGNIWYAIDDEVGILYVDDQGISKKVSKQSFPELSNKLLPGFENIYPIDKSNVLIGSDKGLIHFDPSKTRAIDTSFQIILGKVKLLSHTDSLIFGGYFNESGNIRMTQPEVQVPEFTHNQNAFYFSYSTSNYPAIKKVEYSHRLSGLDKEWSAWSRKMENEYTNLAPGSYVYELKARYNSEVRQGPSYAFHIKAPWYASTLAYVIYAMLILGMTMALLYFQNKKFTAEKEVLKSEHQEREVQHQQIVTASQAEITNLRNEKLESEIQYKNKELASATLHLMQKGEILVKIQKELKKVASKSQDPKLVTKEINRIIRLLNVDNQLDQDWEQFSYHFDQVHRNFLQRLQERYPQLSPNDHRLCAYLRMNLSTKEIANLMNLTVRGVEASRYRLRKKIQLETDVNLTDFMLKF